MFKFYGIKEYLEEIILMIKEDLSKTLEQTKDELVIKINAKHKEIQNIKQGITKR